MTISELQNELVTWERVRGEHPVGSPLYKMADDEVEKIRKCIEQETRREAEQVVQIKQHIESKYKELVALTGDMADDWLAWAQSLYKEDGDKITSTARSWKKEMSWHCPSDLEKWCKIKQLVDWKIKDRLRNRGSCEKDLQL